MKILHVIPYHPSPSAFVFAKRQVSDLTEEGHHCEIFFFNTKISPIQFIRQWITFQSILKSFQPDIVHAHYGTYTAFFASLFHSVPFIVTFQGSDINHTTDIHPWREKLGKWMSRKAAKKAKEIICVSQKIFDLLPIGKEKCTIIPCGIDIRIFKPLQKVDCKKKLGLSSDTQYIFFNANNPIVKRLDIAEIVIQKLSHQFNIELLTLNGNVHPDDIPLYLNASDTLLLCSDSEGSPMVIKEALACQLPIVSVAVGDVAERIQGVENCFIVPQNADAIAGKIKSIIELNLNETNGREKLVNDQLDSITTIHQIITLYKKAIH